MSEGRNCVCECVNVYGYVAVFVSKSECGLCICDYVGVGVCEKGVCICKHVSVCIQVNMGHACE